MKIIGFVSVLSLVLCGVGCGGKGGGGISCDVGAGTAAHVCEEYPASSNLTACPGGTEVSSCPTANALGTCTETMGGYTASVTYYSDQGITSSDAETGCKAGGGTWSPM